MDEKGENERIFYIVYFNTFPFLISYRFKENTQFCVLRAYGQKTHPALLASKKLKFFNADDLIEGTAGE